jgi:hypothetical protein
MCVDNMHRPIFNNKNKENKKINKNKNKMNKRDNKKYKIEYQKILQS